MTRKLAFLAVCLAVLPIPASSLGLGDIELQSSLNQPLVAEVQLLSTTPDELLDLTVELASREAFAKANLQRSPLLNDLRFSVIQRTGDTGVIQVTSNKLVQEPFLDFLLQINWKGGQLVREYTVLVDPPVLMPAPTPGIQAPVSGPKPTPVVEAVPLSAHRTISVTPVKADAALAPASYVILKGDTLWHIAHKFRPDQSVTVDQMMLALQRRNPDAFIKSNLNQLKAGATLEIPGREEIATFKPQQAIAEVDRQEKVWKDARKPVPVPKKPAETPVENMAVAEQVDSSLESVEQPGVAKVVDTVANDAVAVTEGRLKLVAPEEELAADVESQAFAVGQTQAGDTEGGFLSKELAVAIEVAETQRKESEELRGQLAALQGQMQEMQRLININEGELLQFRNQLATAPESSLEADGKSTSAQVTADESPSSAALLQEVTSSPVLKSLVGVIAALMLALFWVVSRQRKIEQEMLASMAEFSDADSDAADPVAETKPNETEAPQTEVAEDPIAEADVYIAYGRYGQAAELVTAALEGNPGSKEFTMKLLEIHYASKAQPAFDDLAMRSKELFASDGIAWGQITQMGQALLPGNSFYSDEHGDEKHETADDIVNEILEDLPAEAPEISDAEQEPGLGDSAEEMEWDLDFEATGTDDAERQWELPGSSDSDAGSSRSADHEVDFELPELEPETEAVATADELPQGNDATQDEIGDEFSAEVDEMSTKLDMAKAYVEMGDSEGATGLLEEVLRDGSEDQKEQASQLIQKIS